MSLAYYESISKAEDLNLEVEKYRKVSSEQLHRVANELFSKEKSNTLFYQAKKQDS